MRQDQYLKQGRLEDILLLIQFLGLSEERQLSNSTLMKEDKLGKPRSAKSWTAVAQNHREFFRVSGGTENKAIMLVHRYCLKGDEAARLTDEHIHRLVTMAISMYDRYLQRSDRWKALVPVIVAVIGGAGAWISKVLIELRW